MLRLLDTSHAIPCQGTLRSRPPERVYDGAGFIDFSIDASVVSCRLSPARRRAIGSLAMAPVV